MPELLRRFSPEEPALRIVPPILSDAPKSFKMPPPNQRGHTSLGRLPSRTTLHRLVRPLWEGWQSHHQQRRRFPLACFCPVNMPGKIAQRSDLFARTIYALRCDRKRKYDSGIPARVVTSPRKKIWGVYLMRRKGE